MHYAVRKPDRVASLMLTHSFLATDSLKLGIPYSPSMLRWLPDFLVRSSYRGIMPKGRVSIDLANAAELAIGHTMQRSRDELASRLALTMARSSVANRLHIPQTAITIIDTLDRSPAAVELTQQTANYLPDARRAFLKTGGEFPYIAVPDEVNVHLVVHLRRHAKAPLVDQRVPVPAKPLVLPLSSRRRREMEEAQKKTREEQAKEENAKKPAGIVRRPRRTQEDLLEEAKVIVEEEERHNIEKYRFEIGRLGEFLPGREDPYLMAVLNDCDINLDIAISNALEEQYGDSFYQTARAQAIDAALSDLERAEENNDDVESEEEQDSAKYGGKRSGMDGGSPCAPKGSIRKSEETDDGMLAMYDQEGGVLSGLRGEGLIASDGAQVDGGGNGGAIASEEDMGVDGDKISSTPSSSGLATSDVSSGILEESDPLLGISTKSPRNSTLPDADFETGDSHSQLGRQDVSHDSSKQSEGQPSSEKVERKKASLTSKRTRRKSFPQSGDFVDEYISSEKVGMRSSGSLIGRGPAPYNNKGLSGKAGSGESWMKRTKAREEEDKEDGEPAVLLNTGASLLDGKVNPLDLTKKESEYGVEHRAREERGGHSRSSTPPLVGMVGVMKAVAEDGGFEAVEVGVGDGGSLTEGRRDGWEEFRGRDEGEVVDDGGAGDGADEQGVGRRLEEEFEQDATETEDEESARLREWAMSAQAASQNVQR